MLAERVVYIEYFLMNQNKLRLHILNNRFIGFSLSDKLTGNHRSIITWRFPCDGNHLALDGGNGYIVWWTWYIGLCFEILIIPIRIDCCRIYCSDVYTIGITRYQILQCAMTSYINNLQTTVLKLLFLLRHAQVAFDTMLEAQFLIGQAIRDRDSKNQNVPCLS